MCYKVYIILLVFRLCHCILYAMQPKRKKAEGICIEMCVDIVYARNYRLTSVFRLPAGHCDYL